MVFTGIFALALLKIDPQSRKQLVGFFAAVKEALFVVIAWVMALSPYGIFALVLPVAANLGTESVVLLGSFIFLTCSLIVLLASTLYLILGLLGYDVWRFARTMAPVQVIGLGTRSSRGAAGNSGCEPGSGDRPEHGRPGAADRGHSVQICFSSGPHLWRLFHCGTVRHRACAARNDCYRTRYRGAEFLQSRHSQRRPAGHHPVFVALDLPVEGIGLLIAVDLIIDMFITGANIAANMAATLIIERYRRVCQRCH